MRRLWLMAGLVGVAMIVSGVVGWAQIPTAEERMRDSSLNPEHQTSWRSSFLRMEKGGDEPPLVACYRKDFTLPAKPRQAAITINIAYFFKYWFMVNGQVVVEPRPDQLQLGGLHNLDITKFLRAGHNVLAFKGGEIRGVWRNGWVTMEGIVFGEDGSMVRLLTDDWKGAWNAPDGWENPEAEPEGFSPMRIYQPLKGDPGNLSVLPYYGPIQVAPIGPSGNPMSQPIFDEEKSVELNITLLNMQGPDKPIPMLTVEIMDEFSRKVIGQERVSLSPKGKLDFMGQVRQKSLPAGAYRFRFVLMAGEEEIDRRDYEVACVGEIKQRLVEGTSYEDGLDLKKIWSVDCTTEPKPGEFVATIARPWKEGEWQEVETRVVEGPAGRYRVLTEDRGFNFFAYRYKIERLFVPHLVVVEWPDDAPRSFIAHVAEGSTMFDFSKSYRIYQTAGYQRSEAGIWTKHDLHPQRSNRMQKLHLLYWPNEEEASIHLTNVSGTKAPAAAARITVYEITNDLPALRIADAGDRMIGYQTERGPYTMASTYYAGPLGAYFCQRLGSRDHSEFYRNWYTTTENWIKRMRFAGQNMYLMGHFMYHGPLYPSKLSLFQQRTYGGGDVIRDYISLMLRMFERNGMNMVSNIEFTCPPIISRDQPTPEQIREGAPTILTVGRNGGFCALHGAAQWPAPNYFHPRVQETILAVVGELVDLYRDYPAWKGVAFWLSRCFGPMAPAGFKDEPLDWGYEDYTIDLFQKETGIKIPVSPKDPERFEKRYQWLMANAKQKWIDWRCDQYTRFYRKLRDQMVRARPDLKLYLYDAEPMAFTPQARELDGHYDDQAFMKQVVKTFGFDVDRLKKERGIVIGYTYPAPGSGPAPEDHLGWRELESNQLWQDLFANDGKGGACIMAHFPHYGAFYFPKGKWLFEASRTRQGYFLSTYGTEGFVNVLARSNPTCMPHTIMDVCEAMGRIHEKRVFARAYRSLPNGKYQRLTGNGLDKNIWISRTRAKGAEFAYAANLFWWDTQITLTFAPGVKVHDLIKDQPVMLQGGKWSFRLGPYQVQTFRITGASRGGRSAVRGATVRLPEEAEAVVEKRVEEAKEVVARAHTREAEIRDLPGWKRVEDLEQMIPQIEELKTSGDLARAYEIAASWRMEQAQQQVVKEALEAIPFLVLGPFGDPEDTVGAGEITHNPEVVPEYKGMETPYLGESDKPDLSQLVVDFAPDLTITYSVYPDQQVGWQATFNTYHLSFYGKCHSEMPLWMAAYAYTEVYSPQEQDATIWVGSDHAIWVWVNGQRVIKHGGQGTPRGGQRPSAPDQNRGNCHLQKGWNRVLIKVVQRGLARIFFRIADRDGNPIADLRFRVPKA